MDCREFEGITAHPVNENIVDFWDDLRSPQEVFHSSIEIFPAFEMPEGDFYSVLNATRNWQIFAGSRIWSDESVSQERILPFIEEGLAYLAKYKTSSIGTIVCNLKNEIDWPSSTEDEAVYLQKLAVLRTRNRKDSATKLSLVAEKVAKALERPYCRLECFDHEKLTTFYSNLGYKRSGTRTVEGYPMVRYEKLVA